MKSILAAIYFIPVLMLAQQGKQNIHQESISLIEVFKKATLEVGYDSLIVDVNKITSENLSVFQNRTIETFLADNFKSDKNFKMIDGKIVIDKYLEINARNIDNLNWKVLTFNNFLFKKRFVINGFTSAGITISNCKFEDGFSLDSDTLNTGLISNCELFGQLRWASYTIMGFKMENSFVTVPADILIPINRIINQVDTFNIYDKQIVRRDITFHLGNPDGLIHNVGFHNNRFVSKSESILSCLEISSLNVEDFIFTGNSTNQLVNLNDVSVRNRIEILDNNFKGFVSLGETTFTQSANKNRISWSQISGNKLSIVESDKSGFFPKVKSIYFGKSMKEVAATNAFNELLLSYQTLLNIFKVNGDQESINDCFAEMKEKVGLRLRYNFETNGGFKNYFSWKINRLLSIYTRHGTDPAQAVVSSIYIIFIFAIFYFFFPSDWDITSKSNLINNYRKLIGKNNKGYVSPLIRLLSGFLISLINALALSLNAFTTLGFGNIPTHGVARYVCILQGFAGWFLLSIFTVALINQVSI